MKQRLVRFSEAQEKIDAVRSIVVHEKGASAEKIEQNRAEKKEAARRLRGEMLLNNAVLIKGTVGFLQEHPAATKTELLAHLAESNKVVHPEKVEAYVEELIQARDGVMCGALWLKKEAGDSPRNVGEIIYDSFLKSNEHVSLPTGAVEVGFEYPLAITLVVEPEYFSRIDMQRNIGGFYTAHSIFLPRKDVSLNWVPLIVVEKTDMVEHALQHEEGHSRAYRFMGGLHAEGDFAVWGEEYGLCGYYADSLWDIWEKGTLSEEEFIANLDKKKHAKAIYDKLISWGLGRAKGEFVAEMHSERGHPEDYLELLQAEEGVYNYFKEPLQGDPFFDALYARVWSDYRKKLVESTQGVLALHAFCKYTGREFLEGYGNLLPWVLAQIPMEQWERQLEGVFPVEEALFYKKLYDRVQDSITVLFTTDKESWTPREDQEFNKLMELANDLSWKWDDTRPVWDVLHEIEARFQKFEAQQVGEKQRF